MARTKTAAPRDVEPEDQGQDNEEQEGGGQEGHGFAPGESGISKAEAIRRALAAGMESPEDGVRYIRDHFGIEVGRQRFSAAKSQIKRRAAEGKAAAPRGRPGRKPKEARSQGVEGSPAAPSKSRAAGGEGELLAAMEAMKPLVASLGKEQVKRIVDLLG